MKRDLVTDIKAVHSIKAQTVTATATGVSVDLLGFNSVTAIIALGAATSLDGSNKIVFSLVESDDNSVFTAVDATVAADNIEGSSDYSPQHGVVTIDADAETDDVYKIGYRGKKRYIKVVGTVTGTVSIGVACPVILGHAEETPAVQTV